MIPSSVTNPSQNPVEILFEDEDLLAIAKPVGLVVDAGRERSVENQDLIGRLNETGRDVFAFHRLDRDTSGIVLLGKSKKYAKEITLAFEEKRIRKAYLAVVKGEWPSFLNKVEGTIDGKASLTTFRKLLGTPEKSWIEALPKTGRKHQIRIHCSQSGFPILGDLLYSGRALGSGEVEPTAVNGHALHAYSLSFRHPKNQETISLRCAPLAWRDTWLAGLDFDTAWTKLFK